MPRVLAGDAGQVELGEGSLQPPDVPPLDLAVLAAGHHLHPRLGGCPLAAVHRLRVTGRQGRCHRLVGPAGRRMSGGLVWCRVRADLVSQQTTWPL